MKALIAYYSRTGTTKKVAHALKEKLDADIVEIIDKKNRKGPIGYIVSGKDASTKKMTQIRHDKIDISKYDQLILGNPVWAWNITPALRTFIEENKGRIKKYAFFCTMGGSGDVQSVKELEKIFKKPHASLALTTREVVSAKYAEKLERFIKELR